MLLPASERPARFVSALDYNRLAKIALALTRIQAGRGLLIVVTEARTVIGLASNDGNGTSQTICDVDLPPIPHVRRGDTITTDHWNVLVTVANAFSNMENGAGVIVTKSEEQFTLEMVGRTGTAATNGSVNLIEKLRVPFPSRDFYQRLAKRLNVILNLVARNGMAFIPSEINPVLQLSGAPLPAIVDQNEDVSTGRFPNGCIIPDFSELIGYSLTAQNSTACGGTGTDDPQELKKDFYIRGSENCYYTLEVVLEGSIGNWIGSSSALLIFPHPPDDPVIVGILPNAEGPTCAMLSTTVTAEITIPGLKEAGYEDFGTAQLLYIAGVPVFGGYVEIKSIRVLSCTPM